MRKAKKFLINAIILTVTALLVRTANVSFTIYISNKIGAEGMGLFQLILSIYMFAVTLAISGIGLASTRLVAEELAQDNHSGIRCAVVKCLIYSLIFSSIAALLLFLNAPLVAKYWLHGKVSPIPIYILAAGIPFLAISSVINGYFTAVRRVIKSASAEILEQFIKITLTIYILNLFAPKGLEYACIALVLGGVVSESASFLYLLTLFLIDKMRYKRKSNVNTNLTKRMLGIAVPVALSSYVRSGLNLYKQIMVPAGLEKSGVSCEVALSQYGTIRGMVMPILLFPSALLAAFSSLLIPEIAENFIHKNVSRISYIISRIFKITLIFSICISFVLFVYADELSLTLYKTLDSANFIKILSPLVVIMYFDGIVDAILKGMNEQLDVMRINILDTIISITLLFFLLPIYGIYGYLIAIIISESFNGIMSIKRLMHVAKFHLLFTEWIILPILIMTVSIIVTKMLTIDKLYLNISISVGFYLIFLFALGVITIKDFKL